MKLSPVAAKLLALLRSGQRVYVGRDHFSWPNERRCILNAQRVTLSPSVVDELQLAGLVDVDPPHPLSDVQRVWLTGQRERLETVRHLTDSIRGAMNEIRICEVGFTLDCDNRRKAMLSRARAMLDELETL